MGKNGERDSSWGRGVNPNPRSGGGGLKEKGEMKRIGTKRPACCGSRMN